MRKHITRILLVLALILGEYASNAQMVNSWIGGRTTTSRYAGALLIDSMFILPVRSNATWNYPNIPVRKLGETYVSSLDSLPYFYNGLTARRPLFFKDTINYLATKFDEQFSWKLYGNTFPYPGTVTLGTSDDRSLTFLVNNTNVGAWTNQSLGTLLVGTETYNATSAAKLQVDGGIMGIFANYSTGGYRYLVHGLSTGNIERIATLPLVDTRTTIRNIADANTSIASTDYIIKYTSLTAVRLATLPLANTMANQIVIVKDASGQAGTHNIRVTASGAETVDGNPFFPIATNYGAKGFFSDGTVWWSIY